MSFRIARIRLCSAPTLGKNLALAVCMTLSAREASAAVLGNLTTSVGLFAMLAAFLALKGWSGSLAAALIPATTLLLLVLGSAAVLWRSLGRQTPRAVWRRKPATAPQPATWIMPAAQTPLPPDRDRGELLELARHHFVQLQAAWDVGDTAALRALTTPTVFEDLRFHLPERGLGPNRTDVLSLHAELLAFEDLVSAYLLSVEFSGMMRENRNGDAAPFRELWMLTRSKEESAPWQLARQQALL